MVSDPGPGDPLHPEEHQEEPWSERLALVETLHQRAAAHRSAADGGADPRQRREASHTNEFLQTGLNIWEISHLSFFF